MSSRGRRFILLAVSLFIGHVAAGVYAVVRLGTALQIEGPVADRFAPAFAMALSTFPLYPVLNGVLPFDAVMLLNSAFCAIVAAFVLVFLRWRTIVAIIIVVPLLIFADAMGTSMWLEHRMKADWQELAPRPIDSVPGAAPLTSTLGDHPIEPLTAYLAKEIARGDDRVDELPQEVDYFLVVHRWEIETLRQRLLNGAPPASAEDPSTYFRMQKILLVEALQTRSWNDIKAAGRLTEAMLHQPAFNSVLYAIAANENQLGVARKLDAPAGAPLPSFDPHARLIDAIAAQAAQLQKISGPWYARPYIRLCLAESATSALRQAMQIRKLRGCRLDAVTENEQKPRAPFNPTGLLAGGVRFAIRANRLLLDREGTERILAAKGGREAVSSAVCPDRKWMLKGNLLKLEPPLPAVPPALPTQHEISVHPASRNTSE